MANVIKHKRGSGSDPAANNLVLGELAIRTDTGKLFTKMDSGAIAEIAGGGSDIAINTLSSSSATGGGSATFNGSAYRFTLSAPPSVSAQQLLVSINGVIQKPVAGTGQPSEGFSVDGTDIILGDAPATGSDFFILTFKSLGVSEPADNSVTSAKIVDGAIVNADINASAAIAGTKIDPDFGSQNITTSGDLFVTGTGTSATFKSNDNNYIVQLQGNNATNKVFIGTTSSNDFLLANGSGVTERLRIDSSGNVGIGTSSPGYPLDVRASSGDANMRLKTDGTGSGDDTVFRLQVAGTTQDNFIYFGDADDSNAGQINYNHNGNFLRFFTNAGERMRIDSSGRLLLGTTTEGNNNGDELTIAKDSGNMGMTLRSGDSSNSHIYFSDATSGAGEYAGYIAYQHSDDSMHIGTNSAERIHIKSSGSVGIGTSSPSVKLHVNGGSGLLVERSTGTSVAGFKHTGATAMNIYFQNSGSTNHPSIGSSNQDLTLGTNNTERLRVLSGGGLTFNGDTAAANALDDYEEGTWTPTTTNTFAVGTSSGRVAVYRKIGKIVFFTFDIFKSANNMDINTNGNTIIGGLPFTPLSSFNSTMTIGIYLHDNTQQYLTNYIDTTPQIVINGHSRINNVRHLWGFGHYPVSD